MTCFRMPNNKTVNSWCKENGVCYGSFWARMENGFSFDEALSEAKRVSGQGCVHPKYYYNGKPVCSFFKTNSSIYQKVLKNIRSGMSVEKAMDIVGVL